MNEKNCEDFEYKIEDKYENFNDDNKRWSVKTLNAPDHFVKHFERTKLQRKEESQTTDDRERSNTYPRPNTPWTTPVCSRTTVLSNRKT